MQSKMAKTTRIDELIQNWLKNVNYVVPHHPSDMKRFHQIIMHGYKRVRNFSSTYLKEKIDNQINGFDEETLEKLLREADVIIAFLHNVSPKPVTKEQLYKYIEYVKKII